jgi:hypothetical protein
MDLIVVLFEVGLFTLEGPRLKIGPISMSLAFVDLVTSVRLAASGTLYPCLPHFRT